jgi:hypothetical protein
VSPLTLEQFAEQGDELTEGAVTIPFNGTLSPRVVDNLRRLRRLDLLNGETVLAVLGQAPIDPIGIFGALKHTGSWAFNVLDCTVVQVLAKRKAQPVALMRIDLLSDDITFVALQEGQLVRVSGITPDEIESKLREEGIDEGRMLAWIKGYINDAVAMGLSGKSASTRPPAP